MRVWAALCVCFALLGCHRTGIAAGESEPDREPQPQSQPQPQSADLPIAVEVPAAPPPVDLAARPWIGDADVHYAGARAARTVALEGGRIATLDRTGGTLSVSEGRDERVVWSTPLPMDDAVGSAVLAWSEPGALVVEWRTASDYHRVFVDPSAGTPWLRESLDPKIATVVHDPLAFILEMWPPVELEAVSDPGSETFADTIVRNPGSYAGVCDPADERASIAARAVEVVPGIVVVAEATYYERDFGPEVLRDTRPECTGATVLDTRRPGRAGRWSTWHP